MVVRLTNLSLVTLYLLNIQGFTGVESAHKSEATATPTPTQ